MKRSQKVVLESATLEHLLRELDESQILLKRYSRRLTGTWVIFSVISIVALLAATVAR